MTALARDERDALQFGKSLAALCDLSRLDEMQLLGVFIQLSRRYALQATRGSTRDALRILRAAATQLLELDGLEG